MKENFWGKMSDEYLKNNPEPPPLTDASLAAFEQRVGLKLPKALTDLLHVKNGGPLQNTDFRFNGKDYQVTYVKAVTFEDSYDSIRTYNSILSDPDAEDSRVSLQKRVGDLSKLLFVAEALDGPDAFALNYDDLNAAGEPTVWVVALTYGEEAKAKRIADSFSEFLDGQYFGDETPIVDLNEAAQYRLLAEGGYSGTHEVSGNNVEVAWKICLDRSRILVFQQEDWGWGKSVTRMELKRSQLRSSSGVLDFFYSLYQRFLLHRLGKEMGANLSQLANTEKLRVSKYDAPLKPRCFNLTFHTHTFGDEPSADPWIRLRTAKAFEGRWKNSESEVWNNSVYSAREEDLKQARRSIAGILI